MAYSLKRILHFLNSFVGSDLVVTSVFILLLQGQITTLSAAPVESSAVTPETLSSGTATTPAAPGTSVVVTKKPSILTHGVFNSWLCGAGYIYNREIKMCKAQKVLKDLSYTNLAKLAPKPSGRSAGGKAANTINAGTQANAAAAQPTSVETAEYVQVLDENISSFFPLECGMNYRYLRIAKMCKPKTLPVSSESDENRKEKSSSEE